MKQPNPLCRAICAVALTASLAIPITGIAYDAAYFTDNLLNLSEVNAGDLGHFNAHLKLINMNPITFAIQDATPTEAVFPVATYQADGTLSIPNVMAGNKRYKVELKQVDGNFELISSAEIAANPADDLLLSSAPGTVGNVEYGASAGESITAGNYNTNVGERAGQKMTATNYNSFLGYGAGRWRGAGDDITAVGYGAGAGGSFIETDPAAGETIPAQTGYDNTYVGTRAGMIDQGTNNVMIGTDAGTNNTTGYDNTFVGEKAGSSNSTGRDNTFVGNQSGGSYSSSIITGNNNVGVGSNTHNQLTSGFNNTAAGRDSSYRITTGMNNTSVGAGSLGDLGPGMCNTAIGNVAGAMSEHNNFNTFIGTIAGWDNGRTNESAKAHANTYLGFAAGQTNHTGSNNVLLGAYTDFSNITEFNATEACGLAYYALSISRVEATNKNLDVSNTVAMGSSIEITANNAVAVGYQARATTTNAVVLGSGASVTHANAMSIGQGVASRTDNTAIIGNAATSGLEPSADATTALGDNAYRYADLHTVQSNITATIGNDAVVSLAADDATDNNDEWQLTAGGNLTIASNSSGSYTNLFTLTNTGNITIPGNLILSSDQRLKRDIQPIDHTMQKLRAVEGKTYRWKDAHKDQKTQYGVIAQEVEKVFPNMVKTDANGMKGVNYQALIPVLLKAIQTQSQRARMLEQQLAAAKAQ